MAICNIEHPIAGDSQAELWNYLLELHNGSLNWIKEEVGWIISSQLPIWL